MTHTLQVLHSLQWHQPSKDERALRPKRSPWLATPTHTRYLVVLMNVSQALEAYLRRGKENTALLSDCGLTGTPLRIALSGLRGKDCSSCVHSVDVEVVGLPSPLLAEVQFGDCVTSPRFSLGRKVQSRRRQLQLHQFTVTCRPVKQRQMTWVRDGGTKTASTYYTLLRLPYNTLF